MIEVAISSMEEALVADGNEIPEGSTLFEHDPLEIGPKDVAPAAQETVAAASPDEPPALL
jgi:hypothetical protein